MGTRLILWLTPALAWRASPLCNGSREPRKGNGDYQNELGIIDSRFRPPSTASEPGGAVMHWHLDDLNATVERLLLMGATQYQPITPHGDSGFITASVVDPFGNVLGVMNNPHYPQLPRRPRLH